MTGATRGNAFRSDPGWPNRTSFRVRAGLRPTKSKHPRSESGTVLVPERPPARSKADTIGRTRTCVLLVHLDRVQGRWRAGPAALLLGTNRSSAVTVREAAGPFSKGAAERRRCRTAAARPKHQRRRCRTISAGSCRARGSLNIVKVGAPFVPEVGSGRAPRSRRSVLIAVEGGAAVELNAASAGQPAAGFRDG
jgi:hypothetical protein